MNKPNVRPIRTFRTLNEAKSSVKKDGYRYTGHESFKEYKILYYSKGKSNMIITSEPHQYLYSDDMIIGTKWYVFNWWLQYMFGLTPTSICGTIGGLSDNETNKKNFILLLWKN